MVPFKSLVILDLEASGLPGYGHPKITELSMVGVLIDHVKDCHKSGRAFPRVLQKLNLCFYPRKRIDDVASEITGLDNFLLEEIPSFDTAACNTVVAFLNRIPSPVCMIAHNGIHFDFPLLKSEFSAKSEELPIDLVCADSLAAFRAIFPKYEVSQLPAMPSSSTCTNPPVYPGIVPVKETRGLTNSRQYPEQKTVTADHPEHEAWDWGGESLNAFMANVDFASLTDVPKANETSPKQSKMPRSGLSLKSFFRITPKQSKMPRSDLSLESFLSLTHENTCIKSARCEDISLNYECGDINEDSLNALPDNSDKCTINEMQRVNETTPKQSKRPAYPPQLRKRPLHLNYEKSDEVLKKRLFCSQFKPDSYKLGDVYRFIRGKKLNGSHCAENDTLALLECIVSTAPEFLQWMDSNFLRLSAIPNMWTLSSTLLGSNSQLP